MTITIQALLSAADALDQLRPANIQIKIAVARTIASVATEVQTARAAQLALFNKYGELNGDKIQVPPDKMAAFAAEHSPFMTTEVDIQPRPLPGQALEPLRAGELALLLPFVGDEA